MAIQSTTIEEDMQEMFQNDDEPEDFADSGSEYIASDISSSDKGTQSLSEVDESCSVKEKGKKRVRNERNWVRNQRKQKRANGDAYVTSKGRIIPKKRPKTGACRCSNKCHMKLPEERQIEIFNDFYKLGSFDLQSSFLFTMIKVRNKIRTYTESENSKRHKTRLYYLLDSKGAEVKVCKHFFQNTLSVSAGRIDRILKKKGILATPPRDRRGKAESINKTSLEKVAEVKSFIEKFPAYESHYSRHKSENRKYLAPDLNLSKMYSFYSQEAGNPVSSFIFRKIFNEQFNLSFHPPLSDSCRKCDSFNTKICASENETEKKGLIAEKELHQRKADSARQGLRNDTALAKADSGVTVITFDLMKTLPTPVLSTGICYYKRQLWTYCLGVHDLGNGNVYMFVWNESIASRGPQEIGSCLLYFIRNFVKTQKLIMYSDQCGGQNRNIKLSILCQYIVSHHDFTVNEIDHKFLVSGHSYLPCDQDFGLVEKQKKLFSNIYIPENWNAVIIAGRKKNPFKVISMNNNDFFSTKKLEANITNRKTTADHTKVEWLKMQWLRFVNGEPFKIYFKYSNNTSVLFNVVDVSKRNSTLITNLDLDTLYPDGNCINPLKKKDLLCLLDYVPPIYHDFYKNLKTTQSAFVNKLPILGDDSSGEDD